MQKIEVTVPFDPVSSCSTLSTKGDGIPDVIMPGSLGRAVYEVLESHGHFNPAYNMLAPAHMDFPAVLLPGARGLKVTHPRCRRVLQSGAWIPLPTLSHFPLQARMGLTASNLRLAFGPNNGTDRAPHAPLIKGVSFFLQTEELVGGRHMHGQSRTTVSFPAN